MANWARTVNNIAVEIIDFDPTGCFTDGIVQQFIPCPSGTQQGWVYASGTFSAPVISLPQAQENKLTEIRAAYQNNLNSGFTSSATGTAYTFAYDSLSQMKFIKLAIDVANANVTWPVPIPCASGTLVPHTQTQYTQLEKDISTFEWGLQTKLHDLITEVQSATTITDLTTINW